jgi:hypothetical protein
MPLDERPVEESVYDKEPASRISPFDPESIQPESRPAPSSTAPGTVGDTPGTDGAPEPGPEEEAEPLPEFDPRHKDAFRGLIYVGALSDRFDWLGHEFHIRTLTTGELAEVALLAAKYRDTEAALKAWQGALVAACTISVDGDPIAVPLTSEPGDTAVSAKFRYVMDKWFPPVLDVIYQRYVQLEFTTREVIEAMGKAPG